MLKITYEPTEEAIEIALKLAKGETKEQVIAAMPRELKEVSGADFEMANHGIKYTDPETGLVHVDLWYKVQKIEIVVTISEDQKKYARAFRKAYSDKTKVGPSVNGTFS